MRASMAAHVLAQRNVPHKPDPNSGVTAQPIRVARVARNSYSVHVFIYWSESCEACKALGQNVVLVRASIAAHGGFCNAAV